VCGRAMVGFGAGGSHGGRSRVCGGACFVPTTSQTLQGRSPRVRGSREWRCSRWGRRGSIPVCAGEPTGKTPGCAPTWVDPRVCGGARGCNGNLHPLAGRSPRRK